VDNTGLVTAIIVVVLLIVVAILIGGAVRVVPQGFAGVVHVLDGFGGNPRPV
jgi:regulator of protease activity HflC (stomatin/prohibitin superfamily)